MKKERIKPLYKQIIFTLLAFTVEEFIITLQKYLMKPKKEIL